MQVRLVNGRPILKVFALGLLLGGIMTIISAFFIFMIGANYAYGTLIGIVLLIVSLVIAGLELSNVLPLFRIELGAGTRPGLDRRRHADAPADHLSAYGASDNPDQQLMNLLIILQPRARPGRHGAALDLRLRSCSCRMPGDQRPP
jgi:hypothetical protein